MDMRCARERSLHFSVAAAMYGGSDDCETGEKGGQACNGWHTVASRPSRRRRGKERRIDMRREKKGKVAIKGGARNTDNRYVINLCVRGSDKATP